MARATTAGLLDTQVDRRVRPLGAGVTPQPVVLLGSATFVIGEA
jgi:hypothetical protein